MNKDDDSLISKLISETCNEEPTKDGPSAVVDLRSYFEKKLNEFDFLSLNDYLLQHDLKRSEVVFQKNSQCYRIDINQTIIDFPSNWSIFDKLKNENFVYISQSFDPDYLLDIFSEIYGGPLNLALLRDDRQIISLVYLPEMISREHVEWFTRYFEKKREKEVA